MPNAMFRSPFRAVRQTAWRAALAAMLLTLLLALLPGCGMIDYFFLKPPEDTARELFEAGGNAMREKQYAEAAEFYTKLIDRYPFSPYTPRAELGRGDAYYQDERYSQAVDAYKEFESLHPRHERIPYVVYMIGMSYRGQFESIDRPSDNLAEAIQYFKRVQESYPDSEYAAKAAALITECRRKLAEHELYVADFYLRQERYQSAWSRYQYVRDAYGEFADLREYATNQANAAYFSFHKDASETKRRDKEGSWRNWFKWL